jgi:hypothetical protein
MQERRPRLRVSLNGDVAIFEPSCADGSASEPACFCWAGSPRDVAGRRDLNVTRPIAAMSMMLGNIRWEPCSATVAAAVSVRLVAGLATVVTDVRGLWTGAGNPSRAFPHAIAMRIARMRLVLKRSVSSTQAAWPCKVAARALPLSAVPVTPPRSRMTTADATARRFTSQYQVRRTTPTDPTRTSESAPSDDGPSSCHPSPRVVPRPDFGGPGGFGRLLDS